MEEVKEYIASLIYEVLKQKGLTDGIDINSIVDLLEIPKTSENGDFAFPCFKLSKVMHKSPVDIANELKDMLIFDSRVEKIEAVAGYLNFFTNSSITFSTVITKIVNEKENYGKSDEGLHKNVVVDFSSPNIAKPFHLGHLRNTVLGQAICNLYKELGYNITGINYIGDWGRQFGLLIEGYMRFKDEYDIENDTLNSLAEIYARINQLAKDDESIMDIARENFKRIENGDEEYLKLWKFFRDISLKEYDRLYSLLGSKFDSYNGEAFYNDKMGEVIDILESKGVLVESQGAKVVEMGENEPPCIVLKSNGSTIYATRDLASIMYRARTYDYDKSIYVTAYDQSNHFRQIFRVAKYLVDEKYVKGLVHVPYGLVMLKTGKMSSRDGNVIYTQDLINDAIKRAREIISEKNPNMENIDVLSKQIGVGALIFNNLKQGKIKDIIFDLEETLRFDGETGPYIQYTYVRTKSILKKAQFNIDNINVEDIQFEMLDNRAEIELIKLLSGFKEVIKKAADEYEPAVLARYLIDISTEFSRMYNDCPVIVDDEKLRIARCTLVYCTSIVIKKGLAILGIESPEKM